MRRKIKRATICVTLVCDRCGVQSEWINNTCPNCGYTKGHNDE